MPPPSTNLVALEKKFWQSMVDQDTDTALGLLQEPALMVSAHGAMQFDHAGYRRMAEQGSQVVTAFELDEVETVFPNDATAILTYRVRQEVAPRAGGASTVQVMNDTSTWLRTPAGWKCVMHTETPAATQDAH